MAWDAETFMIFVAGVAAAAHSTVIQTRRRVVVTDQLDSNNLKGPSPATPALLVGSNGGGPAAGPGVGLGNKAVDPSDKPHSGLRGFPQAPSPFDCVP